MSVIISHCTRKWCAHNCSKYGRSKLIVVVMFANCDGCSQETVWVIILQITSIVPSKYIWVTWKIISNLSGHLTAHVSRPVGIVLLLTRLMAKTMNIIYRNYPWRSFFGNGYECKDNTLSHPTVYWLFKLKLEERVKVKRKEKHLLRPLYFESGLCGSISVSGLQF